MNLLPFVLIFLALFATLSSTLLKSGRNLLFKEKAYVSQMQTSRDAHNKTIDAIFDGIPDAKQDKTLIAQIPGEPRFEKRYSDLAQLNVYAFLVEENCHPHLEKTFMDLLDILYGHLPLYVEAKKTGCLARMLSTIKTQVKELILADKNPNQLSLLDLFKIMTFEEHDEQYLLYKLIKGTHYYSIQKEEGIPPLGDFIRIERKNATKPIRWRVAKPEVLQAYFGDFAKDILALESARREEDPETFLLLDRQDLNQLVSQNLVYLQKFQEIAELLDNSAPKQPDHIADIVVEDERQWAKVEKKVDLRELIPK